MAHPVEVTLQAGNKVSLNYQSQEVNVSITYQLERGNTDVLAVVRDKTSELVAARELLWNGVKGEREPGLGMGAIPEIVGEMEPEAEVATHFRGATPSQSSLICALWRQGGKRKEELERHLQREYGCDGAEQLSYNQAAALLVTLGQEERERFERERTS